MNCEETLSRLDALGITYEKLDHPAVYTIGEMDNLDITVNRWAVQSSALLRKSG